MMHFDDFLRTLAVIFGTRDDHYQTKTDLEQQQTLMVELGAPLDRTGTVGLVAGYDEYVQKLFEKLHGDLDARFVVGEFMAVDSDRDEFIDLGQFIRAVSRISQLIERQGLCTFFETPINEMFSCHV